VRDCSHHMLRSSVPLSRVLVNTIILLLYYNILYIIFVEVRSSKLKVSSRNWHFGGRQSKSQQSVAQTVAFVSLNTLSGFRLTFAKTLDSRRDY